MKKKLLGLLVGLGIVALPFVAEAVILGGNGGGTGYGTTTAGNVGNCLSVASTSPFLTYSFGSCGGGSSQWTTTSTGIFYNGGNVGIGLTNPAYALDMAAGDVYGYNGTVMAQASTTLFNYFLGGAGTIGTAATGTRNTGTGYQALSHLTTGNNNTANGYYSLYNNTTGGYNTANGYQSLYHNTTGGYNTANGFYSLYSNTTGNNNTANGYYSLYNNTTGGYNTANGYQSLYHNTTGTQNTANGLYSLFSNTTSSNSVALGYAAGYNSTIPNAFYVGDIIQSSAANDQNYSLLYGNFAGVAATTTGQFLTVNGNLNASGNFNASGTISQAGVALGSNAFTSTAYLPLTGGTLSGNVTGTSLFFTTTSSLPLNLAEGQCENEKIVPTVASNNLTLTLNTLSGATPSASSPVFCTIGGVTRAITSALSVTTNAGTNFFNAGSAELATKEIDYFAYIGYNATDGVTLGYARIPYGTSYADFSTTNTNEKYAAISTITNATSTDYYDVVGRFAATLGASSTYNWSVPTYTASNLINAPIYYTRELVYSPQLISGGSMTINTVNNISTYYTVIGNKVHIDTETEFTTAGTGYAQIYPSNPFEPSLVGGSGGLLSSGGLFNSAVVQFVATNRYFNVGYYNSSNLPIGAGNYLQFSTDYSIQ